MNMLNNDGLRFYKVTILAVLLILFGSNISFAQKDSTNETLSAPAPVKKQAHSYKPLILKLDSSGKKYIRFILWNQFWVQTNNLSGNDNLQLTPFIRRSRFLVFAQVSPKFLILTHWGLNNLTPRNLSSLGNNGDAAQIFLHDAWGELKIANWLYVGTGLHYWKGLTRLSSASTLNMMTLDQSRPFAAWHSLGITDQFARHFGVYLKGSVGKWEYRFAWNQASVNLAASLPLGGGKDYSSDFRSIVTNAEGEEVPDPASNLTYTGAITPDGFGNRVGNSIFEGYIKYNIFDNESTKLPYYAGTYLGKKKILSLGAGFFVQPNGMYNTVKQEHSHINHFAADLFFDYPIRSGSSAINYYATFINFDYGPNYISRWAGTGSYIYAQLGYLFTAQKLMPYIGYASASMEGADDPVESLNIGVNYFILGHHCKITAEYWLLRNDYRNPSITLGGNTMFSQARLQLHIFL